MTIATEYEMNNQNLTTIPTTVPGDTTELILSNNLISDLSSSPLGYYASGLKELILDHNLIIEIPQRYFKACDNLEYLDMTNNQITSLHGL